MRHPSFSQTKSSSEGLVDRLGINFIQSELPDGLELYARSPDFVPLTLPAELKRGHYTTEAVWGVIRVLEGALNYALEAPSTASVVLHAGESAVIEPQTLHHVHFVGRGRFFIEFHLTKEKMKALGGCGAC